ncbi:MAG: hypothetical protein ABUM26_03010 [Solirubrobacterales bacterium]
MKAQHTLIRLAAIAAGALALLPATASAGIWTPVASGTTADITAVDYVGAGNLVYGTSGGQILKNGSSTKPADAFSINDIAFNPAGTIGLAVANGGRLWRSTNSGDSWSPVAVSTINLSSPCTGNPNPGGAVAPSGNLTGVSWGNDSTAYIVGSDRGMVLKTTNSGANWSETSRQADGSCRVGNSSDLLTDVDAVTDQLVWIVGDGFGQRWISSNGITSTAALFNSTAANCFDKRPRVAVDHDNPNRSFVVDRCDGRLQLGFSEDGGDNYEIGLEYLAGDDSSLRGLNGIAIAGSSALAVGNAGAILVSNDGRTAYFQPADGIGRTNDWLSTDKLDAANAVVVGKSGQMITSTTANAIPDVVAPAGTVSGPTTATAGTPVTYTANVADNAGGSGIDPAGFAWSATGVPTATGNPVTLTFPSAGSYTVRVSFKDLAGNAATASISVQVTAPPVVKPPPPVNPVKTATASVPGAKISFGVPNTCVKAGSTFKVTLTWKKQKRKGNKFVKVRRADFYIGKKRVKIDKKAPFTQTLTVKAGTKAGSTITVKARAFVKVTKGKSPTKSISSKVKVCS